MIWTVNYHSLPLDIVWGFATIYWPRIYNVIGADMSDTSIRSKRHAATRTTLYDRTCRHAQICLDGTRDFIK